VNVWSNAVAHSSASRKASVMPWAVIGSLLYPASPTSAQPGPYGLRKNLATAAPANGASRFAPR
jgi:hypothetical protein